MPVGAGHQVITDKMKRFVRFYNANGGNATQAAIEAGYSKHNAGQFGSRLMNNPKIAPQLNHIKKKIAQKAEIEDNKPVLTPDQVLQKLSAVARSDKTSANTKIKALELLGKHYGLFIDRTEVGGPNEFANWSDEKLHDEIMRLTEQKNAAPKEPVTVN